MRIEDWKLHLKEGEGIRLRGSWRLRKKSMSEND